MFKSISSSLTVYFCPFFSLFFFHRFFFTHFSLFPLIFFLFFLSFVICLVSDTYLVSDARAFPGRPGRPARYALGDNASSDSGDDSGDDTIATPLTH